MNPDRLKDWGKWKRNLIYWGNGERFDSRKTPDGRDIDVFEPYLVDVEIVNDRWLLLLKVWPNEAKIVCQRHVFDWSLKKISSQWLLSQYGVRTKVQHAEQCLLGEIEIPSSREKYRRGRV